MNKYKKIAVAAVSVVMAGTMALPLAACKKGNGGEKDFVRNAVPFVADSDLVTNRPTGHITQAQPSQNKLTPTTDATGLTYTANTELQISIGYNNADTGVSYSEANITKLQDKTKTLLGTTPGQNTLKPAWATLQTKLGVKFVDKYNGKSAGANISDIKQGADKLAGITAFTASATTINQEGDALLDISQYLDYMPNYKAFLEANPVVWASLIANASTGSMYMIPYFDGNDDIEKFVLLRKDIVETLLNGDASEDLSKTISFAAQAAAKNGATVKPLTRVNGSSTSADSFMGTTGSWTVDVTDPSVLTDGVHNTGNDKTDVTNSTATTKVKVNYTAALNAAKNGEHALGKALEEAAGKAYDGESGNIVDLQNFAINETAGEVTGGQLLKILRAYIDVAYTTEADAPFYSAANGLTKASVFNSACAAWDVDLYTALGRCFVTSGTLLGAQAKEAKDLYLIAGRQFTTQRNTDVASLAGELFGVRGLESRSMNYTYINSQGDAVDARSNPNMWVALSRMNDLAREGLLSTVDNVTNSWASVNHSKNQGIQTLSLHDYVQTQTANYGFDDSADLDGYNFAPILTPVSAWNVDGKDDTQAAGRTDGKEVIMRFTESWRGVKDGGLAVSYDNVKNDMNKLAATLAFIDYCYSSDGQILMTYGPMSTNGNTNPNGTWYAKPATGVTAESVATVSVPATNKYGAQYTLKTTANSGVDGKTAKESYFIYEGTVYTGTFYNGRQIPILTDENKDVFNTVSGHSFTNHARQLLGTTLPLWNKDQGFEYLCTAPCGLAGSDIVNIAINNGTLKHQYQTLNGTDNDGNYVGGGTAASPNYWYTLCPTQLPFESDIKVSLGQPVLSYISGNGAKNDNIFVNDSSVKRTITTDIMFYGFDKNQAMDYVTTARYNLPESAQAAVSFLNGTVQLGTLINYKQTAWYALRDWYSWQIAD